MKIRSHHFWKAVTALAAISLWRQASAHADEPSNLPRCTPKRDSYFASDAIGKGQSGTVLVEYSISAKGKPKNVVVLDSTAPESLQKSALRLINEMRCDPNKEWIANGGPERRVKINVLFQYRGGEKAARIDPEVDAITITAEPVTRPPPH